MRPHAIAAAVAVCLVALSSPVATQVRRNSRFDVEVTNGREVVAREALVRLRSETPAVHGRIASLADAESVTQLGRAGLYRVRSRSLTAGALVAALRGRAEVEYAEPNFIIRLQAEPVDPSFPFLWGLKNSGQAINGVPGVVDADIDATDAWELTTGSAANVVGIIDTGIDYNHPDLAPNMWSAPAPFTVVVGGRSITCAAGTHGYNALAHTCDPADDHNHGTHVSGTIGAAGNDFTGVVGVNWTASMMGLKFLDATGSGTVADAIASIEFAMQAKQAFPHLANVRVLSASWGSFEFSQALLDAILAANDQDMLFVAAAGNYGIPNDFIPMYPASYEAPNIVSVAASTNSDQRAFFSNYGATNVHLAAPGYDILSTTRNGSYAYMSGTSMAAPHVSGAAALVLSHCLMNTEQLKDVIVGSVDPIASMAFETISGGRLNVNSAIHSCIAPPPAPATLNAVGSDTRVILTWPSALGATRYRVKRSVTAGGPYTIIADAHKAAQYIDTSVVNRTTYYYVVSAVNLVGESGNSIEASATPKALSDLEVLGFSAPYAIATGSPFNVSVSTRNNGPGDADPSSSRFYLSSNTLFDANDKLMTGTQQVPMLAPGASAALSATITVPAGTAPGPYFLLVVADADNTIPEKSESNNVAAKLVQLGPDLIVASLTVPSAITPGTTITITDTTRNQGAEASPLSTTRFYFSLDGALDGADTLLGSRDVPSLNGGASSSGSTSVTLPSPLGTGTYYLIATADSGKSVAEAVETNNNAARPVQVGPDLVISAFTVPSIGGVKIDVSDTVANQGTASVPSTVTRFYLSSNSALDASDTSLPEIRTVPALAAGASHSGATSLTLPSGLPAGAYFVIAKTDADAGIAETNELNNTTARPINLGGDLIVASLGAPSHVGAGATFSITDTTTNQGGGSIGASTTQFYLSRDPSLDTGDTKLDGVHAVPALMAGASHSASTTVTMPAGLAPGGYYLFAKADATGSLPESREQNNTLVRIVYLGPDLVMLGISSVAPTKAGTSVQVGDTVSNSGGANAGAFTVRFYLSTNILLDASDTQLDGSRSVASLAAGTSSGGSTLVAIPPNTTPGYYYLIAKSDADNAIVEVSEGNNTAARVMQVAP